ncbi:AAA family ATPase [Jannaschia aquimarina]|uniref:CobQ/CobB/MinD/ParA nucleotide binding domain protein n=1 Tax=Jannaschia aquimarina TaxID=935700 RepID=A0A0D1D9G2_9RHOB|nr:AAA family ATPase [Jannaschia aquimarina]KIT16533.1 CobQ/CobB/MinD/ParA nucleotide binding domain protein [Jannaschia aquimarina]SNT06322.1 pilus assembly protein CpaE [Jannaschia aquimarina]
MSAELAIEPEPAPLEAVTVSRDIQEFDLLIEDMEAELGEAWGDLTFSEAAEFLRTDEAREMRFVVVAIDHRDESELTRIAAIIKQSKRIGLQVILVADGLGPMELHELLRAGADDFAPYPLPESALADAVARARSPKMGMSDAMRSATAEAGPPGGQSEAGQAPTSTGGGRGSGSELYAFQSVVGGAGASTIAVNVAWELSTASKSASPSVCLMDFGLQFGSVATYTDVSCKDNIYEILTDTASMDEEAFRQSLQEVNPRLQVFTAPAELLPLDLIGPEDVTALIDLARKCFDVVIIDMPQTLTQWTDTVIGAADRYHLVLPLEVRAAQNAMRLIRLMTGEEIAMDRLGWILNRAPGKTDLQAKGRIQKLGETLEVKFDAVLPDGGKAVTEANDQALPLSTAAARSPLRKELAKLADGLGSSAASAETGSKKKPIFGIKLG